MIPDYSIRESVRAKHVRFKVSAVEGLVVVVPKGFNHARVPQLLEGKRAWLERALRHIEQQRRAQPAPDQRPTTLALPCLDQVWQFDWHQTEAEAISLKEIGSFTLQVSGPIAETRGWQSSLRQWLMDQAKASLVPWTMDLSEQMHIPIQRVTVRCQKTRWGSYSSKGTISLNAQLLLLPRRVTQYVLIHEICHAVHLNHSAAYWRLVRQWEPDADQLRSELKGAGIHVPAWIRFPEPPGSSHGDAV